MTNNARFGLINYWPVKNGVMADVVGLVNTTSTSPQYTADRLGNANDALLITSMSGYWSMPNGVFVSGDYTMMAWVKNLACTHNNMIR